MRFAPRLLLLLAALAGPGLASAKPARPSRPAVRPTNEGEARLTPAILRSLPGPVATPAPLKACTGGGVRAAPIRIA